MQYIINSKTLALIPIEKKTRVIEEDKTFYIKKDTKSIIEENCLINGSSFEGRKKSSTFLVGTNYKPPIILSETKRIILIPTNSIRNTKCIWLNLNSILTYQLIGTKKTLIEFSNHQKLPINISYFILDRQILRATRLEMALKRQKEQKHL